MVEPNSGGNGLLDQKVHVPPRLVVGREEVVQELLYQRHVPDNNGYLCTGAFLYAPSSFSLISNKFRRFYL